MMKLQKRRVAKGMGALAAAALLAAPSLALARSSQIIRIVSWNIEADTDGISGEGSYGTAAAPLRPGVGTVLAGIGEDNTADNLALAPDILCLEETSQNSITLPPILSQLATDYPSLTFGSSSVQGGTNGTFEDGNGANALIYNHSALTLLNSVGVGTAGGSSNGEYRQVMRYEFQPIGGTAANDFYVYVSHMKSGSTSTDVQDQDEEAVIIRNDEATLPAGSSVLYTGDLNNSDTSGSPTPPLETLNASGNGQGNDPANFSTTKQWLSESATDLEYRDDYQLSTGNIFNDAGNVDYLDGSLHNFGNNGSPGSNVDSPSTTGGSNTALATLTNPSQAAILNALSTASDHLPVVGDYVAVPNDSVIIYGAQTVSTSTMNPSSTGLYWFDGNAPGNFVFTNGAIFTNAGSFTCDDDRNFTGSGSWQNTGYFGKENTTGTTDFQIPFGNSGTVQITSGNLRFDAGLTSSGTITSTAGGVLSANAATINSGGVVNVSGGTLTVDNTLTNNGMISVSGTLSAAAITNNGTLTLSGSGSATVGGLNGAGATNLNGGSLTVKDITQSTLNISGGTLAISGSGSLGSGSISSINISGPGVLDIGSSGMVIEYGSGTSPAGDLSFAQTSRNYPAGSIQRYAQTGFNALSWNGPGINSSYAENDSTGLTAVGVADENDLENVYPADFTKADGGSGTWMGQTINDPNNVLVRMTWYGDGNLDGVVNKFDVAALAEGYSGLAGYIGWSDGDYTYAGFISKLDISLLAEGYVFQGAPLGDAISPAQAQYLLALDPQMPADVQADFQAIAAGQTPEPASVALIGAAAAGLLGRRRRR
jgi:hypothetical protein